MSAAASLPIIYPTLAGKVEGIIALDPIAIQCQTCGVMDTPETVGLAQTGRANAGAVIVLSRIRFHTRAWTGGETDNPRLCADCRKARRCQCDNCRWEFR